MKVLSVNCGSSTLKFDLLNIENSSPSRKEEYLAGGLVDRIGKNSASEFQTGGGEQTEDDSPVPDHGAAIQHVYNWLESRELLNGLGAVGHRVVHGGDRFLEPVFIDDKVLAGIEEVSDLAPLHNEPALAAIRALRGLLGPGTPMVAVFDTAFHAGMPELAAQYAIPRALAAKYGIRRYGFHGLAHRYMAERCSEIAGVPLESVKLVTLQLGNGCSAAAVKNGRSVDTSMGLTPLEGLMMGTRSGDIDPSIVSFLVRHENVDAPEVEDWLNNRSGLLGVSAYSRDMRDLLEAKEKGDVHAGLAVDMFCYRVRKYIAAYLAVLEGADAVVFGGGIGEKSPPVRALISRDMEWCGLVLDRTRNEEAVDREQLISADNSEIQVYTIPVREDIVIARDAVKCLQSAGRTVDYVGG